MVNYSSGFWDEFVGQDKTSLFYFYKHAIYQILLSIKAIQAIQTITLLHPWWLTLQNLIFVMCKHVRVVIYYIFASLKSICIVITSWEFLLL